MSVTNYTRELRAYHITALRRQLDTIFDILHRHMELTNVTFETNTF